MMEAIGKFIGFAIIFTAFLSVLVADIPWVKNTFGGNIQETMVYFKMNAFWMVPLGFLVAFFNIIKTNPIHALIFFIIAAGILWYILNFGVQTV